MKNKSDRIMRNLCLSLLAIQVSWICVHMYYHHKGLLNPWKLGGYAMYTKPGPLYFATVNIRPTGTSTKRKDGRIYHMHQYAAGGCLGHLSKRFYKKLFLFEPDLLVESGTIQLSFYERNRSMLERTSTKKKLGQATLTLQKNGIMHVEEEFCNKQKEFSINAKRWE